MGKFILILYIWQTSIQAPLVIASGAIGFAQYFSYLIPLDVWQQKAVSGALVVVITFMLYRNITTVGKISVLLWSGLLLTFAWLIFSGLSNFNATQAFDFSSGYDIGSSLFFAGLGQASIKTVYSYLGYYNVCHLGAEINHLKKIFLEVFLYQSQE